MEEKQIDTSSLYEVIIKELMEWDPRNGCPEPILVHKIEKWDEEDLGEMFSQTRGDSFRKFESFIKVAEYLRILEEEKT